MSQTIEQFLLNLDYSYFPIQKSLNIISKTSSISNLLFISRESLSASLYLKAWMSRLSFGFMDFSSLKTLFIIYMCLSRESIGSFFCDPISFLFNFFKRALTPSPVKDDMFTVFFLYFFFFFCPVLIL